MRRCLSETLTSSLAGEMIVGVVSWRTKDGKFIVNAAEGRAFLQPQFAEARDGTVAQLADVIRFNVVEFR